MATAKNLLLLALVLASACGISSHTITEDIWSRRGERRTEHRREEYVKSHPDLDEKKREAILEGDVLIGMEEDEVEASWGIPDRKGWIVIDGRSMKLWSYGTVGLTFEAGILTGFRDLEAEPQTASATATTVGGRSR